jgi:hypothetical protein
MYADICSAQDRVTKERFENVLRSMGAVRIDARSSYLGVDLYQFQIGRDVLTVFEDAWSIDVEGPPDVVQRVLSAMRE